MRRTRTTRGLTAADHWDIGLLLVLLTVACLCLAVIWNNRSIPTLWAQAGKAEAPAPLRAGSTPLLSYSQPQQPLRPFAAQPIVPPTPAPESLPGMQAGAQPAAPVKKPQPAIAYHWFGGQRYRLWKTVRMRVTAYAPDRRCCWPFDGTTTASGLSVRVNHGHLAAADTRLIPMYALVAVPGYHQGEPVPVLDRGGAIKGHRLDVLLPSFSSAQNWGAKELEVKVYLPVSD